MQVQQPTAAFARHVEKDIERAEAHVWQPSHLSIILSKQFCAPTRSSDLYSSSKTFAMAEAVRYLSLLGQTSKDAIYSAEHIRDDLAKAWADGKHNAVKRGLQYGEQYSATEVNEQSMATKGMTVARAVNYFVECLEYLQELDKALDTTPTKDEAAQLFDGWDVVSSGSFVSGSTEC